MERKEITLGVEVEVYTLSVADLHIGRRVVFPKKGVLERDESYHLDRSIGVEYASRPFRSIREALFGIKAGLRKSSAEFRFQRREERKKLVPFLAGTWRDRFAATHFHLGLGPSGIEFNQAKSLARHLHGHLPFLIALLANSPVFRERITHSDSNRFIMAGDRFFCPLEPGVLDVEMREEMTFNLSRKKRTPTLEVRPCDANLPEFIAAGMAVLKAAAMAWASRKPPANQNSYENHLKARNSAGRRGPEARLFWNNKPIPAREYPDRFFRTYAPFLEAMDLPPEVLEAFKLFKLGWNGAKILRNACLRHYRAHPRTWQFYFAQEYKEAVSALLNGENLRNFAKRLGLRPPSCKEVKLGGRKW